MFKQGSIQSHLNLKDKILAMDFVLLSCIIILGFISFFAMYSTDGGEFAYHTKSHILRFFVFFFLFFVASFFKTNFWYSTSVSVYIGILILLIWAIDVLANEKDIIKHSNKCILKINLFTCFTKSSFFYGKFIYI